MTTHVSVFLIITALLTSGSNDLEERLSRFLLFLQRGIETRYCSMFSDTMHTDKDYKVIYYLDMDSIGCSSCELSSIESHESSSIRNSETEYLEFIYNQNDKAEIRRNI